MVIIENNSQIGLRQQIEVVIVMLSISYELLPKRYCPDETFFYDVVLMDDICSFLQK